MCVTYCAAAAAAQGPRAQVLSWLGPPNYQQGSRLAAAAANNYHIEDFALEVLDGLINMPQGAYCRSSQGYNLVQYLRDSAPKQNPQDSYYYQAWNSALEQNSKVWLTVTSGILLRCRIPSLMMK
ncbi:hypothetical protein PPACK8108_LOCUS13508 [Phakopsora pachyrhizi]|uniref:Uncharacterized protein n=1 Tax=Phakopsora pachyrhizi TaxID=170000 RepID=A0AAV0B3I0_PHAPC|nr:hypothetical protein PPACK8108_LOCUS13508 [Phakopsora pachyrhizi]